MEIVTRVVEHLDVYDDEGNLMNEEDSKLIINIWQTVRNAPPTFGKKYSQKTGKAMSTQITTALLQQFDITSKEKEDSPEHPTD